MTTKELTKLKNIEREVQVLRSLLISIVGIDNEGRYRLEFVEQIENSITEEPSHTFHSPQSFLAELNAV